MCVCVGRGRGQALLDVRIRPNLCSLHNRDKQLPMHIVAACQHPAGAEAVDLLAEAYIPACWTQARAGSSRRPSILSHLAGSSRRPGGQGRGSPPDKAAAARRAQPPRSPPFQSPTPHAAAAPPESHPQP